MEMHYSCLYFRDQNRELLEYDFCSKISIYRDRVKNITLLEMLLGLYIKGKKKTIFFCRVQPPRELEKERATGF